MSAEKALDQAAQQLADKALATVQEKMSEQIAEKVTDTVTPILEAHEKKLFEQLSANTDARDRKSQDILRGWSRIDRSSGYVPPADPRDLGLRTARVLRAFAASKGDNQMVPRYLRDRIKDKDLSEYVAKGLETGTPSKGGVLAIDQHLVGEFYPLLRAKLSIMELGIRIMPMPKGVLTLAGMTSGSQIGWVGEAKRGLSSRPSFARRKLSSKKAYGNVIVATDLLEESDYNVDEILRDDMVAALAEVLFTGMIHGPGTEHSPLGIDKDPGRTTVTVNSMVTGDTPSEFINKLMLAKVDFDFTNAGWLFGPDVWKQYYNLKTSTGAYHFREEMNDGRLLGYPFRVSPLIEVGADANKKTHQFFGRFDEIIMGVTREVEISMANVGTVRDEDNNEVNAWDEDLEFIKITKKIDSMLRQAKAMAHSDDTFTVPS